MLRLSLLRLLLKEELVAFDVGHAEAGSAQAVDGGTVKSKSRVERAQRLQADSGVLCSGRSWHWVVRAKHSLVPTGPRSAMTADLFSCLVAD